MIGRTFQRRLTAALVSVLAFAGGSASAQQRDDRGAYQWSLKCYVANGHALGMRQRAGDTAAASYYEAKTHLSFDTAVKLGKALHLSGPAIDRDFETVEVSELPTLIKDDGYFQTVAATCKALGLM